MDSSCYCLSSPAHPPESGDVNPPHILNSLLLNQQQCRPSACLPFAPTQVQGREQSVVLAEGKIQPEELYTLSRPHPRPRPASRQGDSRQPIFCCHLRPQPSLCTTRDDNLPADNSSAQPPAGQDTGHQVPHSTQDSPGSGPCPECSSGSCVALGLQSQALKHALLLSHPS